MSIQSCKDCLIRFVGCHSTCKKYIEEINENKKIKKYVDKIKNGEKDFYDYNEKRKYAAKKRYNK